MNRISLRDTQIKHQYVFTTVGAGSLLKSNAKADDSKSTDDTKPARASVATHHVFTYRICFWYANFWYVGAGFKFVANHFVNDLNIQHVSEPTPTLTLKLRTTGVKLNKGVS